MELTVVGTVFLRGDLRGMIFQTINPATKMKHLIKFMNSCKTWRTMLLNYVSRDWVHLDLKYEGSFQGFAVLEDFRLQWNLRQKKRLNSMIQSDKNTIKRREKKLLQIQEEKKELERNLKRRLEDRERIEKEIKMYKRV